MKDLRLIILFSQLFFKQHLPAGGLPEDAQTPFIKNHILSCFYPSLCELLSLYRSPPSVLETIKPSVHYPTLKKAQRICFLNMLLFSVSSSSSPDLSKLEQSCLLPPGLSVIPLGEVRGHMLV